MPPACRKKASYTAGVSTSTNNSGWVTLTKTTTSQLAAISSTARKPTSKQSHAATSTVPHLSNFDYDVIRKLNLNNNC